MFLVLVSLGLMFGLWYRSNLHVEKQFVIDRIVFVDSRLLANFIKVSITMATSPEKLYIQIHQYFNFGVSSYACIATFGT